MERLSTQTQESGFISMHSQRSSTQSYTTTTSGTSSANILTKRSSQTNNFINYNTTQSSQIQSQPIYSQCRLSQDNNGSIFMQKTISSNATGKNVQTSSSHVLGTSAMSDPASFVEKLVNVGVACFVLFYSNYLLKIASFKFFMSV